ncbi:MAG: type II toxin-antitoxin system prevent-host-death family antitoxin [Bifidobacteriaceae bacterium]|jgi:prevent-host-death family protein|nr:type II toxin-antitoxin system prevent-host-death family antitoxin [Bifidobacteriaceae bacterium]
MSTVRTSVAEAGRNLSKLVARVRGGDEVVITRRGQPAARLVAAQPPAPGHGNGRRAAEALNRRLAARKGWASEAEVESTIKAATDGWGE